MGEATRGFREIAHNSLRIQTPTMTERKIDPEVMSKRAYRNPDVRNPPGRPTNDQRPLHEDEPVTGRGSRVRVRRQANPADPDRDPRPEGRYAPNPLDAPFTGFAPARRCAGTRSRAGSEYPTDTILSPW